ncbi:CUB and sushi domain-containing protein 1-like [Mizuhopecten yessoensis]|uniref:Low-density lipoprotein receptor-related protein 3 n=1 Tax=Mizuhopecten yessoensis TaxID=6573 RepID=A0A210Q4M1_MIZYE|nr:CUB and sushi domain-containing protein 1-like [Mizuhopecten yessoensis]OWF43677.1 Low-density lipoprotein receptor-related protein 3 [Mizuhopecten yessoensis]
MATKSVTALVVFLSFVAGTVRGQGTGTGNGNKTEITHHVMSTNFPQPYPPNTHQQWNYSMDHGQWTVIFRTVDIEQSRRCQKDYLYIYDGASSEHPEKRLCDKLENMADFRTTHSSIRIVFHSDDTGQAQGFDLNVVHIPNEDYYNELLLKRHAQAAKMSVVQVVDSSNSSDLLIPLTVTLVILFSVLISLTVYLLVCLRRKKSHANDTILAIQPHRPSTPSNITSGRRYTRQLSVDSDNLSHLLPSNKPEAHSQKQPDSPGYNSYI